MSLIDIIYNFVDKPETSDKLLDVFLENNMIAYKIIIISIPKPLFKKNIKSYDILSNILEKELIECNTDDYKIDICKKKLDALLKIIYKYDKEKYDITKVDTVNGLYYIKNVISEQYSKDLILFLDKKGKWKSVSKSDKGRKVIHYGYQYDYNTGNIKVKADPIPEEFTYLITKLEDICKDNDLINKYYVFNQVIVNNYDSGQGISSHTDIKTYGGIIGCYTLGSGGTMRFTNGYEKYDIYVEPNSLYIMSGDARYKWKHEMISRKSDIVDGKKITRGRRISITFRNVPETDL